MAIFMQEKQAAGLEVDEHDKDCVHAVAYDDSGKAIGIARLLPDGRIEQVDGVLQQAMRKPLAG